MTRASRTALRPRLTRGPSPRPAPCVPWHPPTSGRAAPHEELGRGVAPGAHRRVQRRRRRRPRRRRATRRSGAGTPPLRRGRARTPRGAARSAKGAFGFDAHGFDVGAARERRMRRRRRRAPPRTPTPRRHHLLPRVRTTAEPRRSCHFALTNAVFSARGEFGTGFAFGTERAFAPVSSPVLSAPSPFPEPRLPQRVGVRVPKPRRRARARRVPGRARPNARAHGDVRAHLSVRAAALVQASRRGSGSPIRAPQRRNPRTPRSRAAHARAPRRRAGLRRFFNSIAAASAAE